MQTLSQENLDSEVDVDAEQAWREEIERRIVQIDEGSVNLVPWEDVRTRLKRRLQR